MILNFIYDFQGLDPSNFNCSILEVTTIKSFSQRTLKCLKTRHICWHLQVAVPVSCASDVKNIFWFTGLVNGSNALEGRVEIYVDGQWGTVCDDFWGLADGVVACQQLGYGTVYDTLRFAQFGGNTDIPIVADNLHCIGNEDRLQNCYGIFGNTSHNCDHTEDAGIICINASKFGVLMHNTVSSYLHHNTCDPF